MVRDASDWDADTTSMSVPVRLDVDFRGWISTLPEVRFYDLA